MPLLIPDQDPVGHPPSRTPPSSPEVEANLAGNEEMMVATGGVTDAGVSTRDETTSTLPNQELGSRTTELTSGGTNTAGRGNAGPGLHEEKPFQRWVRSLHKRALRQQEMLGYAVESLARHQKAEDGTEAAAASAHRRESSDSSFAFVATVKPASVTVASASLLTRSRKTTIPSCRGPQVEACGQASICGPRASEDSIRVDRQDPVLDSGVLDRALQRRRIIEELVTTEEAYIRDLRFLANAYVTILASLHTSPAGLRPSVNRTLNDMVELHEEILRELHLAVSDREYQGPERDKAGSHSALTGREHRRWRSLDTGPDRKDGASRLRDVPGMLAEPKTAAKVARVFLKRKHRFFIYEEYSAVYDKVKRDVEAADRVMPGWTSHQKGLEVLGSSLSCADSRGDRSRRALAIADLVVKPIQRACKYHLLFKDLSRHTPVIDCPSSHMEIEKAVARLLEAADEINRATNSPKIRAASEKTRTLQTRLAFPDQVSEDWAQRIRWLGHLQLCGVLHVCWQTRNGITGRYMVALLYRGWLCLAIPEGSDQRYTIQACIALGNLRVEEVDNNRGLQCHTARHSWKIVFLSGNQLYELMLTACSPKEELEWRSRLSSSQPASPPDDQEPAELDGFTARSMNIKTLGTVFRKSGTNAKNISIHRATTIGPKPPLCQVILKNTSATRETPSPSPSPSPSPINRSQSVPSAASRIPVVAPPRAERARLEALIADVWTREVLPFPGIPARSRSEQLVRASASSVMRKLSSVSITSSFRRSASLASMRGTGAGEKGGGSGGGGGSLSPGAGGTVRRSSDGDILSMTPPPLASGGVVPGVAQSASLPSPVPTPDESARSTPGARTAQVGDGAGDKYGSASSRPSLQRSSGFEGELPSERERRTAEMETGSVAARRTLSLSLSRGLRLTRTRGVDRSHGRAAERPRQASRSRSLRGLGTGSVARKWWRGFGAGLGKYEL